MTKFLKDCDLEFRDKRIQIGQEEDVPMKQFTNELSFEMRFIICPRKISNLTAKVKLDINCNLGS